MVAEDQAVWVTEQLPAGPRDIYDITKLGAEGLCRDFFDPRRLQTLVLRVSRFWDEPLIDKVFYRMYRGVDVRDVAAAHQLAIEKNFETFEIFNVSAQPLFSKDELETIKRDAIPTLRRKLPELIEYYQARQWAIPASIDRVYVIEKAKRMLGYQPRYNIERLLRE